MDVFLLDQKCFIIEYMQIYIIHCKDNKSFYENYFSDDTNV